jgi:hypothetical protein
MRHAFNSNLYVVAATVIPVFFIAFMLPGGILARYGSWAKKLRSSQLAQARKDRDGSPTATRTTAIYSFHWFVSIPPMLFMVFTLLGEISAVRALDHRRASGGEHTWVIDALVGLPIIAVVSTTAATSFAWAASIQKETADSSSAAPPVS